MAEKRPNALTDRLASAADLTYRFVIDKSTNPQANSMLASEVKTLLGITVGSKVISAATSDLTTDLATGTDKAIFFMPFDMTVTEVMAGLGTVCTGSTFITDINQNGTTILSTKISIDISENTSLTAATPPVISVSALSQGDKITIDFDQVGATIPGKAHTIYLIET